MENSNNSNRDMRYVSADRGHQTSGIVWFLLLDVGAFLNFLYQ